MSLEQADGTKPVDARPDVWALAVIAFRCMTGRLPSSSQAIGELSMQIMNGPPPLPAEGAPESPPRWAGGGGLRCARSSGNRGRPARAAISQTMITFDTGALVAIERRDRRMLGFMTTALEDGMLITVPSCVIGEWWRDQRGPATRLLDALVVEPLTLALAKLAGETMAAVRGATLVDTVVVASAAQRGDVVITSEIDDLSRIRDAAFRGVRLRRA